MQALLLLHIQYRLLYSMMLTSIVLCLDDAQFKNLVVWLEDQKIRHYLIENRSKLKDVQVCLNWFKNA